MNNLVNVLRKTRDAENVYHLLNGVFVVYKPAREHIMQLKQTLKFHLCRDLNKLEVRPPEDFVKIEGATNQTMTVAISDSYADHPLVVGPRYQLDDIKITFANRLLPDTSGVLVCGVNKASYTIKLLRAAQSARFYKLKGKLGRATDNFFFTGRIAEKTTYKHVRREHLDRICASMQSSYQKQMFDSCGLSIQSQAAYELAIQGPIRPASDKIPMVYSIKCVDFNSPEFTIEIVCMNEDEMFLKEMIHTIGIQAKSTANCTQLQCFRFGLFTSEHALLKKNWNLEAIAHNILMCEQLLAENKFMKKQMDPILKEYSDVKQIQSSSKRSIA